MRSLGTYCLISFLIFSGLVKAQNNVGIGTKSPHLTAILEVKDTNRGFLLPRTDTASIENYVNSLVPNPGIEHGLTIYEVNMRTIYIYNGILQKWQPITSLKGPQGPTGVTGPTGPRGDRGIATQWRDSALVPPLKREPHPNKIPPYFETLGDTCGDFYHQTNTGLIWVYDCTVNEWTGPVARWRNFGVPKTEKIVGLGLLEEPMPLDTLGDTLSQLANLTHTIFVPPDTIAYVWVTTEGNVQKKFVNFNDYNKMVFDFYLIDSAGVEGYLNQPEAVTIGPNILVPNTTTVQYDKVPWEISTTLTLEGKISPAGNPLPANDYRTWTISTHYGQFFMSGNTTHPDSSRVLVLDNSMSSTAQNENFAVMSIYIVYERSPNAAYPY